MTLEEILVRMPPSDRIIIQGEKSGKEIYRGYIGCIEKGKMDQEGEVTGIQIATDIYRREKRGNYEPLNKNRVRDPVNPENTSQYELKDLEMKIYTRIRIKEQEG